MKMLADAEAKNIVVPEKHLRIRKIRANETYLLACRGSFKTTRAIPFFVSDMVYSMPRSSGMMCGISFEDMGNNTINPFLGGLAELGYYEGEHYVIGRKPPSWFDTPYLGVLNGKYDRVMSWDVGTAMHIVSMEKKAPANGLSVQWGVFDEVKFQSERKLLDKIFPTFRGNEDHFAGMSCYLSKFFATDKEADPAQIKWLLDKRKLVDQEALEIIEAFQDELTSLQVQLTDEGLSKRQEAELQKQIDWISGELNELRKGLVYVAEINIEDVRPFQSKQWYEDKKRNSTPRIWRVVYLNKDPLSAGETFYPNYEPAVHEYEADNDIVGSLPLIITPDYQHSVTPITISQLSTLPDRSELSLNYVDVVYTLPDPAEKQIELNGNGSKGSLNEAVQLFCDRYKGHPCKMVYYIYDHTAKGRRVNANEYFKLVEAILIKNGWTVVKVYTGKAPDHYLKYSDTSDWLKHDDPSLPTININKTRCLKLTISIANSSAKTVNGKTEKNKEYENTTKYPEMDQSETTHFSDCFDMTNHAVLKLNKIPFSSRGMISGPR